MAEIIAGVHPTRMELLALKKRRNIAERGRDLLREKLDALMIEFFEFVREISDLRNRAMQLLTEAYLLFAETRVSMGINKLQEVSMGVVDRFVMEGETRNVIGVTIPHVKVNVKPLQTYPYSPLGTTAKLDDANLKMVEAVKLIAELSGSEAALRKLAEAIAATKRRVNSLEYIIIPRMLNTVRYIEMHLQEREREEFFRLKRIKARLEKQGRK